MREQPEHRHRTRHAADGPDNGQQGLAERRQFTHQHLALDLETDGEKENGHKRIVDKLQQCHGMSRMAEHIEVADLKAYLLIPELEVLTVYPGHVGNGKRKHRGRDKDIAAGCMVAYRLARGIEYSTREHRFFSYFGFILSHIASDL